MAGLSLKCLSVIGTRLCRGQARFPWVFRMLAQQPEARDYDLEAAFRGSGPDELLQHAAAVLTWLKSLPLGRRPLVLVRSAASASLR